MAKKCFTFYNVGRRIDVNEATAEVVQHWPSYSQFTGSKRNSNATRSRARHQYRTARINPGNGHLPSPLASIYSTPEIFAESGSASLDALASASDISTLVGMQGCQQECFSKLGSSNAMNANCDMADHYSAMVSASSLYGPQEKSNDLAGHHDEPQSMTCKKMAKAQGALSRPCPFRIFNSLQLP
jgi:hypothetical protein